MDPNTLFWIVPVASVLVLAFAAKFFFDMKKADEGNDRMKEIAGYVREGAMAYLKQQYKVVAIFFVIIAIAFGIMAWYGLQNHIVPVAFLTGGIFSGLAGFIGMKTATYASGRVAQACRDKEDGLNKGLQLAFRSGAVLGLTSILDRLHPRKIVIVSSSPQVRYPDYYGIDMSSMEQFITFRAAMALLKEQGKGDIITSTYNSCKVQEHLPKEKMRNYVKNIYEPFTDEDISTKIAELLTPPSINAKVEIVYQSIEGLRKSCPIHTGDWYFSGDYPTCGGLRLLNKAFIDYIENEESNINT